MSKKSVLPAKRAFEIRFLPRVSRGKKHFYPHKCLGDGCALRKATTFGLTLSDGCALRKATTFGLTLSDGCALRGARRSEAVDLGNAQCPRIVSAETSLA